MKHLFLILISLFLVSCTEEPVENDSTPIIENVLYFPPNSGEWETMSMSDANFDESNVENLLTYLEEKNTKGFIVLKNGKIVIEEYFNGHSQTTNHYWASAAKTLTGTVVGIAQEEGYLDIANDTSDFLGTGWTSLTDEQEQIITIKHQLSMTSGLNDEIDTDCTVPVCLTYMADAGTRWAYHNAPYTVLQDVITSATEQSFRTYFETKLKDPIGMDGFWFTYMEYLEVYSSSTRSMARFGLLALNDFKWNETPILNDISYVNAAINTSQDLNKSYGYLWWLNGKESYMLPHTQYNFTGSLIPAAPDDMYMAMGRNDQRIYVIPSKKIVIIRMGDRAYEADLTLSTFDNELWEKLNVVID